MGKNPAFQFYPADWLMDSVSGCSLAAQGLWLRMMIVMHSAERRGYLVTNGRPMTDEFIASKCGCDIAAYRTLLSELSLAGVPRKTADGILYNKRMVEDERAKQETKKRVQKHRCNADVTQMKRGCNAYEDEDEVKSKELNPTEIATSIARELRISDFRVTEEIRKQLEIENKTSSNSLERDGLRILAAAQDYKQARSQIDFAWGWQRFFGEGYWANRAAWKVKNGTAKPVSAKEQHDKTLKGG